MVTFSMNMPYLFYGPPSGALPSREGDGVVTEIRTKPDLYKNDEMARCFGHAEFARVFFGISILIKRHLSWRTRTAKLVWAPTCGLFENRNSTVIFTLQKLA